MQETSRGTLLGGRVSYEQFLAGHRSGFEPVLLAASLPARAGDLVLELGTGAGAALLCLVARVQGVRGIGIERRADLAGLAARNFAANGAAGLAVAQADATALPFASQTFHHAMANPPWFPAHSTQPPDAARALAHHARPGTLAAWVAEMLRVLRPRGVLSLVLPAQAYAEAAACLRPACGGISLLPFWPRAGLPAKMILIRAQKAARTPDAVLPGLILHDATGLTRAAEAVLRDGAALL